MKTSRIIKVALFVLALITGIAAAETFNILGKDGSVLFTADTDNIGIISLEDNKTTLKVYDPAKTELFQVPLSEVGDIASQWSPWQRYVDGDHLFGGATLSLFGLQRNDLPVYVCHSLDLPAVTKYQFGDFGCFDLQPDSNAQVDAINYCNMTIVVHEDEEFISPKFGQKFVRCSFPEGLIPNGDTGMYIQFVDTYTYLSEINPAAANNDPGIIESYKNSSYYDPETKKFYMSLIAFGEVFDEGQFYMTPESFMLPGFIDYYIHLLPLDNEKNADGVECPAFEIQKAPGIAAYSYKILTGNAESSVIDATVNELINDSNAQRISENVHRIIYEASEEGDYTFVAVGFKSDGSPVYSTSENFNFVKRLDWNLLGEAIYTDGFIYGVFNSIGGETWNVKVEQHKTRPGLFRIINPYKSGGWPIADSRFDIPGNYYITINAENPDAVYIEESQLGIQLNSSDGPLVVNSLANYYLQAGYSMESIIEAGVCGTFKDGLITFPGVSLLLGFTNDTDTNGNIRWYSTNYSPDIPVMQDGKVNQEQYNTRGSFMLDLNDFETVSAQRALRNSSLTADDRSMYRTFKSPLRPVSKNPVTLKYVPKN